MNEYVAVLLTARSEYGGSILLVNVINSPPPSIGDTEQRGRRASVFSVTVISVFRQVCASAWSVNSAVIYKRNRSPPPYSS